jgi:hypothetical protein
VKDGAVGTLASSETFIGMDSDGAGSLYALVAQTASYFDPLCQNGCLVQRIDVAAHTVLAEATTTIEVGAVVATHHDPVSGKLVVGHRLPGDYYFEDDPYPGFQVSLLSYE